MWVTYYDGNEPQITKAGATRREALARHGDGGGTGLEYARNPAGGCRMVAERATAAVRYCAGAARYSAHGTGPRGVWGPWCATLAEALRTNTQAR